MLGLVALLLLSYLMYETLFCQSHDQDTQPILDQTHNY